MKTFNTIQQYAKSQNNLALIKGTGEVIYQIPKNAQFLTGNKYVHYNRKLYGPIKYYGEINDGLMFMGDGTTQKANIFEYTYTDGKDSHTVAIVTDNFMEAKIDISPATPAEVKMSPILKYSSSILDNGSIITTKDRDNTFYNINRLSKYSFTKEELGAIGLNSHQATGVFRDIDFIPEEFLFDGVSELFGLFTNNKNITSVPADLLKDISILQYIFNNLFLGCVNLKELPANFLTGTLDIGSCQNMFDGSGLTHIDEGTFDITVLPTASFAMENMFSACTRLRSVKGVIDNLPSNIGSFCSNMFLGCTSLVDIGNLDADWFASHTTSYPIFSGCINIRTPIHYNDIPAMFK